MSSSPRPTLADFIEKVFALEVNPQLQALLTALMLAFGFWFSSLDRLPTKNQAVAAARRLGGCGVVVRAAQNPRGEFELNIMDRDNRLIQQDFWTYYYPLAVAADTANPLSYEDWQRLSLAAYARVGDSLVKKPGSLVVQVKRGTLISTFYYRNPYP